MFSHRVHRVSKVIIIEYLPEIVFLVLLILLAIIPKKKKWVYLWFVLFTLNIGVRVYLIYENHNKTKRLSKLQDEVDSEKRTIRDFESKLKMRFSGKWTSKPYPGEIISPVNNEYYVVLKESDIGTSNQLIKFYATQAYSFTAINDHCASFESRQAVRKGDYPISNTIDELYSYDAVDIHIPFVPTIGSKGQKILIEEVELLFFINGKEHDSIVFREPKEITIDSGYASFGLSFTEPFPLPKDQ